VGKKHGKKYCFPSQETLLRLLRKFYGIERSRRTLNRWLTDIESSGYIRRKRRIRRDPRIGIVFQSTLYRITKKGYLLLCRIGVDVWDTISGRKKKRRGEESLFQKNKDCGLLDPVWMRSVREKARKKEAP